ncbi:GNAT family N-acetyltransferase [Convivina intestini]|uniref:GNAT family N-acetyltransferase n=1 Tax=Convivina intestini TaxID=1505726 RepID=UPI00200BB293|nr:GNAT family N-acetyltransferase [Convivina intestini]CAH1853228.1 Putative phosphinothricin acetyltransferase YwnH [Convivina intestini]
MLSFRPALRTDFERITTIYNQAIQHGNITADLVPETPQQRMVVLEEHLDNSHYPLLVLVDNSEVIGYGYLSTYNIRPGYQQTAEVSYYLDMAHRGQGLGTKILRRLLTIAQDQGFDNLVATTFSVNTASNHLLLKHGFALWGELPNIARNQHGDLLSQQLYGLYLK